MIHSISVAVPNKETPLTIEMGNPRQSGFSILDISGLGPVKGNINIKDNAISAGGAFTSSRIPERNIVLTLLFEQDPTIGDTIEEIRIKTYEYFPIGNRIEFSIVTEAGTFRVAGYVESNEPTIFSMNEGTTVSIICPDPFFRDSNGLESGAIHQVAKLFEFADGPGRLGFSNPVGTDEIVFGEKIVDVDTFLIPEDGVFVGTVPVGPLLRLDCSGPVRNPAIYFMNPDFDGAISTLYFDFGTAYDDLAVNDRLLINCEPGAKSVRRYNAVENTYENYIGAVAIYSIWPLLRFGMNQFTYSAEEGVAGISFSYEYEPRYNGI